MKETPEARSRIMRTVKSRDTAPEMVVRRLAHGMGYRFRVCRKDLPGSPDIVFPKLRKVILVHGCFWHGHDCVRGARVPTGNRSYWLKKVASNRSRDEKNLVRLAEAGWKSLVVWECAARNESQLRRKVGKFLANEKDRGSKDLVTTGFLHGFACESRDDDEGEPHSLHSTHPPM
jgi:DNA mismatch endonuclease (patch repair protein)